MIVLAGAYWRIVARAVSMASPGLPREELPRQGLDFESEVLSLMWSGFLARRLTPKPQT